MQPGKPWQDVNGLLRRVLVHFERGGNLHLDDGLLQSAYTAFVDRAELELAQVTDSRLTKSGHRSSLPRLVWKSVMPEARHVEGKEAELAEAHSAASGWMWVLEHTKQFLGLLYDLQHEAVPDGGMVCVSSLRP